MNSKFLIFGGISAVIIIGITLSLMYVQVGEANDGEIQVVGAPYTLGDLITIKGKINDPEIDSITIEILDEQNNLMNIAKYGVSDTNGSFKKSFSTEYDEYDKVDWKVGTYTARVAAEGVDLTTSFEIKPLSDVMLKQDTQLLNPASFVTMSPDMIAQKLVSVTNDDSLEKILDDKSTAVYTTQKGDMRIGKTDSYGYSRFVDYGMHGKEHAIPKDQAEEFIDTVFETIGYQRDGTEWVDSTDFGSRKEIVIQQRKDGWIIQNELNRFNFRDDSTSILLGRWYNDLDDFEIRYSQTDAKEIAHDYIHSTISADPKLKEMNLEISDPSYAQMKIAKNHLVYGISGIYPHTEVQVDTYSGSIVNAEEITITGKEIPGCASIGVTRLVEHDVAKIEKRTGTLLYFELTDDDLESLPVLKEMIDATNRTEYNDRTFLPISMDEWNEYKEFFKEKFDEQHEVYYDADLRSNNILHDGKRYHAHYNENYEETPLWVEILPDHYDYERRAITISEDELLNNAPLITKAIDMIGTFEVSARNSTAILEGEQQRYQNYLLQKSIEKYGEDAERHAHIFYYAGNYYEPSFAIC